MHAKSNRASIRPGGILKWSTLCLLASLSGCDDGGEVVTSEEDQRIAEMEKLVGEVDSEQQKLLSGEVTHGFFLQGIGYYHADAHDFFAFPYGYEQDGKYFLNGEWKQEMTAYRLGASRPSEQALKRVEEALVKASQDETTAPEPSSTVVHHHHGSGTNALLMYWLLSGNRDTYQPTSSGFHSASGRVGQWQQNVQLARNSVSQYAASHPHYRSMTAQSARAGVPVRAGTSVRGGFGSSASRGGSFSFGS